MSGNLKFAVKQLWHRLQLPVARRLGRAARKNRRVYDLVLFNRELELLEVRLGYLDPVVDVFVIGESETTFIGEKKPLWFAQNRERFKKYEGKIRHVVIPPPAPEDYETSASNPAVKSAEHYHRRALRAGVTDGRDEDVVLYSDADEIPSRAAVEQLIGLLQLGHAEAIFRMRWHVLYLNALAVAYVGPAAGHRCEWFGTVGTTVKNFRDKFDGDANRLWQFRWGEMNQCLIRILDGGWHFSYLGGLERLAQKQRDNAYRVRDPAEIAALHRREFASVKFEFRDSAGKFPAELEPHLAPIREMTGSEKQLAGELAKFAAEELPG